jgi:hypothetical protein
MVARYPWGWGFFPEVPMPGQAKIVKVRGSQVTVEHDDGTPETSHQVYAGATVSLNGRPAMLSDLRRYDLVSMLGNPVTVIAGFPAGRAVRQSAAAGAARCAAVRGQG